MNSNFFFSLGSIKPLVSNQAGSLTCVTAKEVPGFVNTSFANLKLSKRGSLDPIWHANAHKIGYCTQGKVLVVMRTPNGVETFTVKKGEMFFIPHGYVHHIENIGEEESVINFTLSHSYPEMMYLSKAVHSISDSVFNSTFNTSSGFIDGLKKAKNNELIKTLPQQKSVSEDIASQYKFDIEDSAKTVETKGGYLQVGTKANLPVLQELGILGFGLNPKGCVEPHWHTNAGELVYIVKGKTRITVLSPNGHVEVLEVKGGEGAFAPACHFHNIENIGPDQVEVIAFFSHATPDYIGIGEAIGAYSNEVLASIFNVEPAYFNAFKKPEGPLVIVPV
ncbi:cupin domain-containing protein [Candidatus Protochlamydia phocaeensis]|uniref:cupin domain-containing protein n=1 Tax=Candidatus Protochlamydia phocaeensis TaxID=1414722 RepID=UPI00083916E3|nr:cupin domain-containing protein [Candidatus Protochlamydia phocaeensis]